jgi:hypothetical protein
LNEIVKGENHCHRYQEERVLPLNEIIKGKNHFHMYQEEMS